MVVMSLCFSCWFNSQQDDRYKDLMHRLHQGTGDQDVDYRISVDGLVRFRDRIYVPDNSELKKLTFREFHANPYSGHPSYHKPLIAVKKFCYWTNFKKKVVEFMARYLDFQ